MHAGTDPNFWGRIFNNEEIVGLFKREPVYKRVIDNATADAGSGKFFTISPDMLSALHEYDFAYNGTLNNGTLTGTMNLKNPFTQETRELYRYRYDCMLCGFSADGGLELNHIWGRVSASPYNASLLCVSCHGHIGHSQEEHAKLFVLNSRYLAQIGYKPTPDDMQFIDDYVMPIYNEITTCLQSMNTESTSPEESIGTSRLPTLE